MIVAKEAGPSHSPTDIIKKNPSAALKESPGKGIGSVKTASPMGPR